MRSKVVRFHRHGEPLEVLVEEEAEVADPGDGRVRVGVAAVGLNPADWELCRGFMAGQLPRGIGYDIAGTVEAVGPGVDGIAAGDLVFGTTDFAGQPSAGVAELAILDSWYPVPDGVDPVRVAVLPMVVQTAEWTLDAMGVGTGTTLLVNGAGAMVGFAAVQIALRRGARVIASAGATFADDLAGFGAEVTPYGEGLAARVRALAGGPVDLVLDTPPPREGSIPELVAAGGDARRVMTISNQAEARRLGARVNLDELGAPAPAGTFLPGYAAMVGRGELRLPVATVLPLGRWRDAVRLSMSGRPHGKVVLTPDPGPAQSGTA